MAGTGQKQGRVGIRMLILAVAFLGSCGPQVDDVTKECVLKDDQKNTLIGKWNVRPIKVAVIANDFSSTEIAAIKGAITAWNGFFNASKGYSIVFEGNPGTLGFLAASTPRLKGGSAWCSQVGSMVSASGFTQPLVIQKVSSGWQYSSSAIGITTTCPALTGAGGYQTFYAGMIEVNFSNFFGSGQPVPDLQSVVTHELGHLVGLNHSCQGSGQSSGFISCAEAPEDYINALMYPALGFIGTQGKVSRSIRTNDQQRANCLY